MSQAFWAYYFLAKVLLHLAGSLRLHALPNLALLVLAMPFSPRPGRSPLLRRLRQAAALAAGAAVLWYDSYLPPWSACVEFLRGEHGALSAGFLSGFLGGFVSARGLLAGVALLVPLVLAARLRLHLTPAVSAALLLVPLLELRRPQDAVGRELAGVYEAERGRRVTLPAAAGEPFDLIVVHVCSLGWDDLAAEGVLRPRLLEGANLVFSRFNSATSYSGPAALRLHRALCGQVPHQELYGTWPAGCALMPALRAAGFATASAANFPNGSFGQMGALAERAGTDAPLRNEDLPVRWLNFDGEKVFADYEVLARWWRERQASGAERAALYYDSVSLHGGVHEDEPGWWKQQDGTYARALEGLGRDLERLYDDIEAAGRSAVVLLVSEHGRASRGSAIQPAALRDIPLPAITRVPAAVRLVGPLFKDAPRGLVWDEPSSYLALAQLLGELLADPRVGLSAGRLEPVLAALPRTPALSETASWKVYERDGKVHLLGKDGAWRVVPADLDAALGPAPLAVTGGRP